MVAKKHTEVEELFNDQLEIEFPKLAFMREWLGIPSRKFRFDFALTVKKVKVAIEIQGGVFINAGHSTGVGITRDCEKLALSNIEGWTVFHFTSGQVRNGQAIDWLKQYLIRTKVI